MGTMTEIKRVQTITNLVRMDSSRNGNPRFRVFFEDGSNAPTEPDAAWSYGAENSEFRAGPVEVHYNGRGHITYARIIEA